MKIGFGDNWLSNKEKYQAADKTFAILSSIIDSLWELSLSTLIPWFRWHWIHPSVLENDHDSRPGPLEHSSPSTACSVQNRHSDNWTGIFDGIVYWPSWYHVFENKHSRPQVQFSIMFTMLCHELYILLFEDDMQRLLT